MYGTYQRLNLHVAASNIDVIRAVRRKLKKSSLRDTSRRKARHGIYREMIGHHKDARNLYVHVQRGM